jgi:hypothetical protein
MLPFTVLLALRSTCRIVIIMHRLHHRQTTAGLPFLPGVPRVPVAGKHGRGIPRPPPLSHVACPVTCTPGLSAARRATHDGFGAVRGTLVPREACLHAVSHCGAYGMKARFAGLAHASYMHAAYCSLGSNFSGLRVAASQADPGSHCSPTAKFAI